MYYDIQSDIVHFLPNTFDSFMIENEQAALDNFVSLFRVVPISTDIAKTGGLYKRNSSGSHGVGLADAVIAATAEFENAELKTLNTKHYPMLKGLRTAYAK
jgi:predicted nucleic acid-binding protein